MVCVFLQNSFSSRSIELNMYLQANRVMLLLLLQILILVILSVARCFS